MSLFHFHVTQIKRSAGQSAVACAAYRAGEKLRSEYYGEVSDYTRKGGVVESGIMLPEYVPKNLSDREKKIMMLRYGLNKSGKHYAQRDVAKILGISRSYVSRLEKSAINKIKEYLAK